MPAEVVRGGVILATDLISILCPKGDEVFFVQWSRLADFEKASMRLGHTVDTIWTQARFFVPSGQIRKQGRGHCLIRSLGEEQFCEMGETEEVVACNVLICHQNGPPVRIRT